MKGKDNYWSIRKEEITKWLTFLKERFEPLSHFLMIFLFVFTHYAYSKSLLNTEIDIWKIFILFFGTTLFFLKLRLYDEIKDYEVDLLKNPKRPLPRGLVNHYDLKNMIEKIIPLEIILFSLNGFFGLMSICIAVIYSLFMYKEFFIGKYIRPHLTTYATSHTVVTFFLSMALFAFVTNSNPFKVLSLVKFALISWLLFNIFELGRKTYQKKEERPGVESYSIVWTRPGAFVLVLIHSLIASYLTYSLLDSALYFMISLNIALILIGLLYLAIQSSWSGKLYRIASSVYIIIFYSGLLYILN